MRTQLFWIEGPWPGRLAITSRPRGADWLEEEIHSWRQAGIEAVVSLLTPSEVAEFDLNNQEKLCQANGIEFMSFPIVDRSVPSSLDAFGELLTAITGQLTHGKNVVIHCRQGIGRAGLVAISVLILAGLKQVAATQRVSLARGTAAPETPEQRRWIQEFANLSILPTAK